VTADVVAACGSSNASFTLTATDTGGGTATAMLNVTVTPDAPASGIVNWYPANSPTANDPSGTANGVLMNGAAFNAGVVGTGFSFDGVNDYVKLPDNFFPFPTSGTGNTPFTFSAWFKTPTITTTPGVIFGQQNDDPFSSPGGFVPGVYVG